MSATLTTYWITNTGTSSSRSYWEGAQAGGGSFNAFDIPILPVAITVFPAEISRAPRSWGEQSFGNLNYWHVVDKGGHVAAWKQPQLFSEEVRAAFRSLLELEEDPFCRCCRRTPRRAAAYWRARP
jgi:hypothetical protein